MERIMPRITLPVCSDTTAFAIWTGVAGAAILSGRTVLDTLRYLTAVPGQPGVADFYALAVHEHLPPERLAQMMDADYAQMDAAGRNWIVQKHKDYLDRIKAS